MRSFILRCLALASTGLVASASAACMCDDEANDIAAAFGSLVSGYDNYTANQLFTSDFIDYSESINSLKNGGCEGPIDLMDKAFVSKADFETQSAAQLPVPFEVQNVWHTCDVITVRWLSAQSPQPVFGISVLETVHAPRKKFYFQIKQIFAEFDSVAWIVNLGFIKPECNAPPMKPTRFTA